MCQPTTCCTHSAGPAPQGLSPLAPADTGGCCLNNMRMLYSCAGLHMDGKSRTCHPGRAMAAHHSHLLVACRSMLDICVRSIRKADCGTVIASRQATCSPKAWETGCTFVYKAACSSSLAFHVAMMCSYSAHAREYAVCEAYACSLCRHKGAHVCHEDNERNLLRITALACVSEK